MEQSRTHSDHPSVLPAGTRLGEFELLRVLGVGGFGIVYLAFDHALEREVAVKEYLPALLAGRTETLHVSLRSQSDAENFALGLKSFINEARLLARFDHPSLLKVYRFWEDHGTAYMAMPVLRGRTLKELRAQMSAPPDEAALRRLLAPLLSAIDTLHQASVYHRDIAPDNIQIEPDGRPVLLDFGAARRVLSDKSQTLTAILKPAYAPIEQYGEAGAVKQGPWTDLYALGATLHYALLGRPPAPATARALVDDGSSLVDTAPPGYSQALLLAIDWMLQPRPADRPHSVAQLQAVLSGQAAPPRRAPPPAPPADDAAWDRTLIMPPPRRAPAALPEPETIMVPPPGTPLARALPRESTQPAPAAARMPAARRRPRLLPLLGLAAVALAGVAAVVLWPGPRSSVDASVVGAASAPVTLAAAAVAGDGMATAAKPPSGQTAAKPPSAQTATPLPAVQAAPSSGGPVGTRTSEPAPRRMPPRAEAAAAQGAVPISPVLAPVPAPALRQRDNVTRPAGSGADTATARAPAATSLPDVAAAPMPAHAPETTAVSGPEARCGGQNPLRYFVCMERACLRSDNRTHPDCLKWRRDARHD